MINVRPSHAPGSLTPNELNPTTRPAGSVATQVIELFHKRLHEEHPARPTAPSSDVPSPHPTRIAQLLRFAVTQEQPSLDEQISLLIQNTAEPLTDEVLRNEVTQRLNQPSAINPHKTYAQLIQDILAGTSPRASNTPPAPTLLSRQLRDTSSALAPATRNAPIRQFAEALIDEGDRQLAIGVANSLMRQRLAVEKGHSGDAEDKVAVPADSTFGQAWAELADALHSEPFKSFAESRKLDIAQLTITPDGRLIETSKERPADFTLRNDAGWAAASGAVLAAVKKVAGDTSLAVDVHGRHEASAYNVAAFYGLQLGRIKSDHTLATIGQLLNEGNFNAFSNTDPNYATEYAPIKQRQRDAIQRIMDLPPDELELRLEQFTPSTVEQKVQNADQTLAQQCSQAMMRLVPQARVEGDEFPPVLKALPEYSTFNQVRKNLLDALAGSAFTTFAQENNVEPRSVAIHPVTGELTGRVNGNNTAFNVNDVSGWSDAWAAIKDAVQHMAAGADRAVRYPSPPSASLFDVMDFYHEEIPRQQNGQQSDWRQRQLISLLDRSTEMTRNNGFKALIDPSAGDNKSKAVRERQHAITQQLANTPTTLSTLETLAAAVESSSSAPMDSATSAQDALDHAETALAAATYRAMRELKNTPTQASPKRVGPIPANSLFGQWRSYLDNAIKARGFTEWAEKHQVDLTSLRFDAKDEALIGKVDGVDQRFTAADFAKNYPEHFDVLAPVLTAASVFATPGQPIPLSHASSSDAPLEWVGRFYGLTSDPRSQTFERSMTLLDSLKKFPRSPDHPQRMVKWLSQQKTALGDSNDRYALINQLKNGNIDNDGTTRFIVDQDSSHRPKGMTTVQKFLADQGWYEAKSAAQVDNLLRALQTPMPQAPALGNSWGFLSTDLPLSPAQCDKMNAFVKNAIGSHPNLLSYLSAQVPNLDSNSPAQALDQLLSSDGALELATQLQTEMNGAATVTSLKQWLLSAMVLELDPAAGTSRNTLAGFDLMQPNNWGLSTDKIREQFTKHLHEQRKVPANLAPVAARLLMTGAAPHLLIQDVPSTVTLGSTDWVSFMTAVNRIELNAPGAATDMTFEHVMNLHRISPVSERESQLQSVAQMNPVMDWAIVNNHVVKNDKDEYTLEQLTSSQQALQKHIDELSDAKQFLRTSEPPSRRKMALEALRAQWGADIDYERPYLTEKLGPSGVFSGIRASIVDVYEAGRLNESWRWESTRGPDFDALTANASDLPDINAQFNKAIKEDFALRRSHTISLFKDMFSKLPLDERDSLNFGAVEYVKVEGAGNGVVMTSVYEGKRRDFAVYPALGKIVRIPDIDPSTNLGEKVKLAIDVEAFNTGAEPKSGVQSEVVLKSGDQFILMDSDDNDASSMWWNVDLPERSAHPTAPYDSERFETLSKILVDSVYLRKPDFVATQHGFNNRIENGVEPSDFFKGLLRTLPGGSSLIDIYHGDYTEAAVDLGVDVVIYAATEGLGKLWSVAKSGAAWAATKASAKFIEKFGAQEGVNIALKDITTASTTKSLSAVSRLQGSPLAEQAGTAVDGTVIRPGSEETIKASAVFKDDEWYAYNARTLEAEGPPLERFVPESDKLNEGGLFAAEDDVAPAVVTSFESKVLDARQNSAAYTRGYTHPNLEDVPGYTSNMGPKRIMTLIAESDFNAEQIGGLIRQRERIQMDNFQRISEGFIREMNAAGGTARVMPQTFYLSHTHLYSRGECAGLSTAMAVALQEGTENTLLDNLAIVSAADRASTGNAKFLEDLTKLEEAMKYPKDFHGPTGKLVPYSAIVDRMSKAKGTTMFMINAEDHAMVAGVRIDPKTLKPVWYFYEPSYGLAKFSSPKKMKAGLDKLLRSGPIGTSQIHYGTRSTGPMYGMSTFSVENIAKNNLSLRDIKNMSQPL